MQPTCKATTKSGKPCRAPAMASGWCMAHDPAMRERMRAGRTEGGRQKSNVNRARRALPSDLQALADRLVKAMDAVESGDMAAATAHALAALIGRYVDVVQAGTVAVKLDEMVERLEAVERAAA